MPDLLRGCGRAALPHIYRLQPRDRRQQRAVRLSEPSAGTGCRRHRPADTLCGGRGQWRGCQSGLFQTAGGLDGGRHRAGGRRMLYAVRADLRLCRHHGCAAVPGDDRKQRVPLQRDHMDAGDEERRHCHAAAGGGIRRPDRGDIPLGGHTYGDGGTASGAAG